MKFQNIIIGKRSNLSQNLRNKLQNSYVISSEEIINLKLDLNKNVGRINLIINSFYPSIKLQNPIDYNEFIEKSLLILTKILNYFELKRINKIIYTSSSSIYNLNNNFNLYGSKLSNREIYSITKLLCEKILIDFTNKNKINLSIARLFNVYGGDDNFSIINKIIRSFQKKEPLTIFNKGNSIRDFIHVDEVCEIYKKLLKTKSKLICDVGKGYGYKIKDIVSLIGEKKLKIKKKNIVEQDISIANLNLSISKNYDLGNYIFKKIRQKRKKKLKKFFTNINDDLTKKEIIGSIIYGAGNAGRQVCDLIIDKNLDGVFCFVDDDKKKIGRKYKGKIIISKEDLKILSNNKKIPNIIVAIPSMTSKNLNDLFNELYKISSSVHNLPLKSEFNTDKISLNDLQNSEFLHIFDKKNNKILNNYYKKLRNKKILVTGAGGSIGSELVIQLSRFVSNKIICLDFSELFLFNLKNNMGLNHKKIQLVLGDINDNFLIKKIIKKNKIDIIFHAAAYKHLNFLEENSSQAIKNNIIGTLNLINAAKDASKRKIKMINISTDKAVKATSVLGISKRVSEIICQSYKYKKRRNIEISTVRFGNVFGSMGSVINLFLEKINKGENVSLTDRRATRFFMSITEACNLVIAASQLNKSFKTLILDMGKPINIENILKKMIKLKTHTNENFNIKINETGLKKGEKLVEELSINKKIKKTKIDRILEVTEPSYSLKETDNLIDKINKMIDTKNQNKIIPNLKKFLKNEL